MNIVGNAINISHHGKSGWLLIHSMDIWHVSGKPVSMPEIVHIGMYHPFLNIYNIKFTIISLNINPHNIRGELPLYRENGDIYDFV